MAKFKTFDSGRVGLIMNSYVAFSCIDEGGFGIAEHQIPRAVWNAIVDWYVRADKARGDHRTVVRRGILWNVAVHARIFDLDGNERNDAPRVAILCPLGSMSFERRHFDEIVKWYRRNNKRRTPKK